MKLSSWWWDFADRCDMKVSRWVLALALASTPVLMPGSAYADPPGCSGCKSENTPPLDKSAAPVPLLTAPEPTDDVADNCGGSGCLYSDEDTTDPDQRRAPPPETVRDGCTSSGC